MAQAKANRPARTAPGSLDAEFERQLQVNHHPVSIHLKIPKRIFKILRVVALWRRTSVEGWFLEFLPANLECDVVEMAEQAQEEGRAAS